MRNFWVIAVLSAVLGAAADDYLSAKRKFDEIESDRLRAGTRVSLTPSEISAYVERELPTGVRNPQIRLTSPGIATGSATVDFLKVQRAQGYQPGWLLSKLLDGERPVSVTARIQSSGGKATVTVQKVQVSGIEIDGRTLDFLIQNFLLPSYPDAAVNRPFELGHRIEQLDVEPGVVHVVIGK